VFVLGQVTVANQNTPPPKSTATPFDPKEVRRLAVIMFTDMVGYSALTQRDEPLALRVLEEHRQLIRPILAQHGGREIKTIGDAFLVEFSSTLAAATCAVAIQKALHEHNRTAPHGHQVQLRIGLHAGDVIYKENDVFGDGVNIAARIEPLAEAGGICISEDVARQIQNKIDCPVTKLGAGELKNIELPVEIYRIILPWNKARSPLADRVAFLWRRKTARRALAAGVLVAAVVAVLLLRHPTAQSGPVNRLAVLPLQNIGGKAQDEYFAEGMTEELISSLSTIRELDVIARTSIARFKGANHDVTEIGAALNVGSILEGSVRLAGDEARINVNLVDVRSQKNIWAHEYPGKIKDIFAIQSDIATSVTDALKVRLLSGEKNHLERHQTDNNEASLQYLAGLSHLNRRTGEEVMKAIESFSRAVEIDPGFALAQARLAEACTLAGVAGYGTLPREQTIERAKVAARTALALDDSLAEAHAALGYVKFRIDWDWAAAETEFKRTLELKPGFARAHELYGLFLAIQGRLEEALPEMRRAQQIDPLSPSVSNGVGRVLHFERKFDEAVAQFKQTLNLDPQYAETYFNMAMSYQLQRQYDAAIAAVQTAIKLSGDPPRPVMLAMLGQMQGLAGNRTEAQRIFDDLVALSRKTPETTYAYYLGIVSIGLGNFEQAMQYFAQAYAERDGILIYLAVDPVAESIWTDPRFAALIRQMGLKDQLWRKN
jgi:adenylate cyclase